MEIELLKRDHKNELQKERHEKELIAKDLEIAQLKLSLLQKKK